MPMDDTNMETGGLNFNRFRQRRTTGGTIEEVIITAHSVYWRKFTQRTQRAGFIDVTRMEDQIDASQCIQYRSGDSIRSIGNVRVCK